MAIVAFVAGTRSDEITSAISPAFGIRVESGKLNLDPVQQTYRQLKMNYDGRLDNQKLVEGASRGLVEAAGDPYTVYWTAEEARQFDRDLAGEIGGGIGAEIGVRNDKPTIIRVLTDHPAEKAGVRAGDVILAVNDENATGWTAEEAANKIRGEIGTTLKLTVARDGETKDFSITRANVNDPSVRSEVRGGIGILTISRFDASTGSIARQEAEKLVSQHVEGVILDLRYNGGGYLSAAQDVAGLWLDGKTVVSERRGGKTTDELKASSDPVLGGIPTVVLVNGASASASEIVAGALDDYDVATLIGEKTFGKGSVQDVVDLADGAKLKVTIAKWYTPDGRNITKEGIKPDIQVKMSDEDVNAGRDPQLDRAIDFLKK